MQTKRDVAVPRAKIRPPAIASLPRARVVDALRPLTSADLGILVGPAGMGKTVALAQLVSTLDIPVAWLSLDHASGDGQRFLGEAQASLSLATGIEGDAWQSADDAIVALEGLPEETLLVLDDLHELEGSAALDVLGRILDYRPTELHVLAAGRVEPSLNLQRRRLTDGVAEVDSDLLRFRTWEVDELFRQQFGTALPPGELASLTSRTEGWAAGLQFFHLATTGRSVTTRRRLLRGLARGPMVREYLAVNVLAALPDATREFLERVSVIDGLTGPRCDRLLDTTDSAERLARLYQQGLFLSLAEDGESYRLHEVLRAHLLASLEARLGPGGQRDWHRRAGALLENEGDVAAALLAYCRSADWDEARRVLSAAGADLSSEPGVWIDLLPGSIRERDPWVLLAMGRRHLAHGGFDAAQESFDRARARLEQESVSAPGSDDQRGLEAWLEPGVGRTVEWYEVLREATIRSPSKATVETPDDGSLIRAARAGAALLAGMPRVAADAFDRISDREELSPEAVAILATARAACAALLSEGDFDARIADAERTAKAAHQPGLTRVIAGFRLIEVPTEPEVAALVADCERDGDGWGRGIVLLSAGIGSIRSGSDPRRHLVRAREQFAALGAPVLASWATVLAALTVSPSDWSDGDPEALGRATGPLLHSFGLLAVARWDADPDAAERARRLAMAAAERCGAETLVESIAEALMTPDEQPVDASGATPTHAEPADADEAVVLSGTVSSSEGSASTAGAERGVRIGCLGGFSCSLDGRPLDVTALRPRHRDLLRLLAISENGWVHRDVLAEALWPGIEPDKSQRNVQVAISAVRRCLEPDAKRGEARVVVRDGSRYALRVDVDGSDLLRLRGFIARGDTARRAGDLPTARASYARAADEYRGELLPGAGPAEWAVDARRALRVEVGRVAEHLARLELDAGDARAAARAARRGLVVDRYRDSLWHLCAEAHEVAAEPAAAATVRADYEEMVAELTR